VTEGQIAMALQEQQRTGALLGETLLHLGYLTSASLAQTLADQGGVPFVELAEAAISEETLALVPEALARRLRVLPVQSDGMELTLAMANIFDLDAIAEIEKHTGLPARVVAASEEDLAFRTAQAFGDRRSLETLIEEAIHAAQGDKDAPGAAQPIVTLVDHLLHKALRDRATDLHIQPAERTVLTRYRVDGSLVAGPSLPKALQAAVLARLKILAEVDIAETRLPQDGKFRIPSGRRAFDVRASFLPATHGEKAVLRILDKSNLIQGLEQLGMPGPLLAQFSGMLGRPHGMLLVTGPTGSGKTTTLYSALHHLNTADRCIVTVEDPVEYELPLIAQVSLNRKAGLTFATGLRAILRQDPDVILVGEIRDAETAAIALRAAMTGHLVLTTLHTNDPVGAIPRLRELGISSLELSSALLGIHAQRLVRLNCPRCAGPSWPAPELQALSHEPCVWMKGAGCDACGHTGVRGRRAIHDLLPISPAIRELVAAGARPADIEGLARREGKGSLRQQAMALARAGAISLEEAVRVTVEAS
jgi:type IV pilus assembly protein PilB